jgi:hypothetical protein
VDQMFNWSSDFGQWPPIFPRLPSDYNTVLNQTSQYGRDYIYVLGKAPAPSEDYSLCGLKSFLTPNCSTNYQVTANGGDLSAECDDSGSSDLFTYRNSFPEEAATPRATNATSDFFELVGEWATSLSLQSGISDGRASIARLLTEFILPEFSSTNQDITLQAKLPSIAEALAVMAASVALISAEDSPFVPYWVCWILRFASFAQAANLHLRTIVPPSSRLRQGNTRPFPSRSAHSNMHLARHPPIRKFSIPSSPPSSFAMYLFLATCLLTRDLSLISVSRLIYLLWR